MSHTSRITAVKITDLKAFEKAVQDLRKEGLQIEVLHNQVPRAYFDNQDGMDTPAKQLLRVAGCKYDIALYEIEGERGKHELRTDFYDSNIAKLLGADRQYLKTIDRNTDEGREEYQQGQLGKLYQRYAYHATVAAAMSHGGQIDEVMMPDGTIQLTIKQAA